MTRLRLGEKSREGGVPAEFAMKIVASPPFHQCHSFEESSEQYSEGDGRVRHIRNHECWLYHDE
jgi:hypothetical protein